jgi:hypothetical protein
MRDVEMITPKAIAAVYASARHPGGASAAGAIVQKAADAALDTNEQFFSHGPPDPTKRQNVDRHQIVSSGLAAAVPSCP